jgi:hypothetical protein
MKECTEFSFSRMDRSKLPDEDPQALLLFNGRLTYDGNMKVESPNRK